MVRNAKVTRAAGIAAELQWQGGETGWNGSFFILTNLIATSQQFAILVESAAVQDRTQSSRVLCYAMVAGFTAQETGCGVWR